MFRSTRVAVLAALLLVNVALAAALQADQKQNPSPDRKLEPDSIERVLDSFRHLGLSDDELEDIQKRLADIRLSGKNHEERVRELKQHPDFKAVFDPLRKRFEYQSLAERLAFEKETRKAGQLDKDALERLARVEASFEHGLANRRDRALNMLHKDEVARFVASEGLGVERTIRLNIPRLSESKFPLVANGTLAPEQIGKPVSLPATGGTVGGPQPMPARNELTHMHLNGQGAFLGNMGLLKERRVAAGFLPHALNYPPHLHTEAVKHAENEQWQVRNLELVSLLKHAEPAVYVTKELPRMDKLGKVPTRPLADFESRSLEALKKGEDVVAEATTNTIRMFGSIRATKQCLNCHDCERGALLGAFSYLLERTPPAQP